MAMIENQLTLFILLAICLSVFGRPNIIILIADDLGFNDLSFHGSSQIPTPNLDALAKDGIILNNYYVCPVCSPSRGALMTGLYPIHTGLQHGPIASSSPYGLPLKHKIMPLWFRKLNYVTHAVGKDLGYPDSQDIPLPKFTIAAMKQHGTQHDVIYVDQPWGLPLAHSLLPQHLRDLGYATHAIGKWHLGFFHKEYTPTFRGFDSHYGYWGGKEDYFDHTQLMGQFWGLDFHQNLKPVTNAFGNYSTFLFSNRAANIIQNHNTSKPLFLYVAYQAVHSANMYAPLQAPADYIKKFSHIKDKKRRIYAAMVSALDDSVNQIIGRLKAKNMLKNSIIVFSTDNGGPAAGFNDNAASNWPLRGVKATLWEGGVRGVSFIWSPLLKNPRRTSWDLMHITDWLPTLYRAAGGNVASLGKLDGFDLWDTLSAKRPSPRSEVLLNIDPINLVSALRVGDMKLVQGTVYGGQWDGWYGPSGRDPHQQVDFSNEGISCKPKPANASTNCKPAKKPCLFNVTEDPCEFYNLANDHPEIVERLLKRLSEYNATAVPPGNKPADPRSDPKYHDYQWINWMDYTA